MRRNNPYIIIYHISILAAKMFIYLLHQKCVIKGQIKQFVYFLFKVLDFIKTKGFKKLLFPVKNE